jgi:hypothetical protein
MLAAWVGWGAGACVAGGTAAHPTANKAAPSIPEINVIRFISQILSQLD